MDNETFEFVEKPQDRKFVPGRWVYGIKVGEKNERKYEARYVAKDFMQIENINHRKTFSPTEKICSICMIIQLAAQFQYCVSHMDLKSACLNVEIDCEIYVEQPAEFDKAAIFLPQQ